MASSAKQHHPEAKVIVCLLEEELHPAAAYHYFDKVILAKHLGIHHFYDFIFKHNVFEAACALKAFTLKHVMEQYTEEREFIYLDTDMKVFHHFDELLYRLQSHPIVLTPHQLELAWNTISYFYYGTYNAGFIAVSRSYEAERFIQWWADRMYYFCYRERGLSEDQKWLNLVPALFNDVHILRSAAYNMAAWNLHERSRFIVYSKNGTYFRNDGPLCLFHFACLDGFLQSRMKHSVPDRQHPIYTMLDDYLWELEAMGRSELIVIPWSYEQK